MTTAPADPLADVHPALRRGLRPHVKVWLVDRRTRSTGSPMPAVLHIHGGGYITGVPAMKFGSLRRLSAELDCLVVSVDYRLAPRTRFPGALEDNHAALGWLHANAQALNIDPTRIAVMGDSAGGGHAAALAIAARDRGQHALAFQVLIHPMLDDRTGSTRAPSSPKMGALMWTAAANVFLLFTESWQAALRRAFDTTALKA